MQLSGNSVTYSQRPLSFNPPSTSTVPLIPAPPPLDSEPSSPRPVTERVTTNVIELTTSSWKRKQEESYSFA
ncbi:uncharacterized protein B0P05DRAFT_539927 [Gilbertella persicaria]|uniref:uncharacterized protein n=1 Tax=Gilbertella persicaria TaxID=101096 RepID=UPI00221E7DE5|nr:uncharacterized protein B0P05DRAFT_539927 [Gilbertella persicaria]KAI8080092.1 hypothetical protein B0P05DRAFT_539927 [Gilbertella persicaria]